MPQAVARIETANARRYMIQLCKHFGHKRPTSFDDAAGSIDFDFGEAFLTADQEALTITAQAIGEEQAQRLSRVMESHLKRFAFREPDLAIAWLANP
jgi:hypothetical protein